MNRATVSRWEKGGIQNIGWDKIALLAAALNLTTAELVGLEAPDEESDQMMREPQMTPQQAVLFDAAEDLTEDELKAVLAMIDALKARR